MKRSIFIGFDGRETAAFAVARTSSRYFGMAHWPIRGLHLGRLRRGGLYRRPTEGRGDQLWDTISDAPMSTEFAISRFLAPHLAKEGWALFMDADMMVRKPLAPLFDLADPRYAVMCVKHAHEPVDGTRKMDGQLQTAYARKNWSSVMLFNCDHPSNAALTVDLVNTAPGRDLHAFSWLADNEIGEIGPEWNYLVGHTAGVPDPAIVHHTEGTPDMRGYEDTEYADEWRYWLERWADAA